MKPRIWAGKRPPTPELFAPLSKLAEISVDGDQNLLAGSTVVISGQGRMFDGPWMDGVGPQLQLLAMPGIGLDHIDVPAATDRGFWCVTTLMPPLNPPPNTRSACCWPLPNEL